MGDTAGGGLYCAAKVVCMSPAFALAIVLGVGPAPLTPRAVLGEALGVAARLTTRTERSVAYLVIGRAQNGLGDRGEALASLRTGWTAFEKGSDKGLSAGDAFDVHSLIDGSDVSMLPIDYAYEFVVAGDLTAARRAALSVGASDLADSYRGGLRDRLRKKYPEAADAVTLTEAQIARQEARRAEIRASLGAIRVEPDLAMRAYRLYEAAGQLPRGEAVPLLREAATVAQGIEEPAWRAQAMAQVGGRLWQLDVKDEARRLLALAEKALTAVPEESDKRKGARYAVEQTKETMGLPNDKLGVYRDDRPASDSTGGSKPGGGISMRTPDSRSPWELLSKAEEQRAKGDVAGARRTLRSIRARPGAEGPWRQSVGELQTKLGDREAARGNLAEASRSLLASFKADSPADSETLKGLEVLGAAQIANGDRAAARTTLVQGFKRLAGTKRWAMMPTYGNGPDRMVRHDRQSPVLHAGAMALARLGFFADAVGMARTIPSPAHRAVALAGVVVETSSARS
jgi:hypothetical protein